MNQNRFKEIIEEFVIYLYPDLKIEKEVEMLEKEYATIDYDGAIIVKGDIDSNQGYRIKRSQDFLPVDKDILEKFFKEINLIESYPGLNDEYKETLILSALNNAIALTLSPKSSATICRVINALSQFGERTYEGNDITYGVVINDKLPSDERIENLDFTEYTDSISSSVLTNGTESFIEVDSEGYITRYFQLNEKNSNGYAPYNYTRILEYCGKYSIGIVLTPHGEILIFHDNELKYTKRGRHWNAYSHEENINELYEYSENDDKTFSKAVYLTSLDISFSQTGGIISFLNVNQVKNALKHIYIRDIINEKYFEIKRELMKEMNDPEYESIKNITFKEFLENKENIKSCVINRLVDGRKFYKLYRKLRQELVSIDGATIVDYNGDIVAVGAIVKIEAGSIGGGRLAAAKTLSHYGVSIEISSDSSIKAFSLDNEGNTKTIFSISDFN